MKFLNEIENAINAREQLISDRTSVIEKKKAEIEQQKQKVENYKDLFFTTLTSEADKKYKTELDKLEKLIKDYEIETKAYPQLLNNWRYTYSLDTIYKELEKELASYKLEQDVERLNSIIEQAKQLHKEIEEKRDSMFTLATKVFLKKKYLKDTISDSEIREYHKNIQQVLDKFKFRYKHKSSDFETMFKARYRRVMFTLKDQQGCNISSWLNL